MSCGVALLWPPVVNKGSHARQQRINTSVINKCSFGISSHCGSSQIFPSILALLCPQNPRICFFIVHHASKRDWWRCWLIFIFPRNFGLYSTGFDHPNVNRIKNSRDQIAPYIHGCDLAPSCSNFHPLCIPIGVSITRNTIRVSCLYKLSTSHKQRLLEFRLNKMILVPKESLLVFVQVL